MDEKKITFKDMTFGQKLSHIFYYYKWHIIILAAICAFFIICIAQCSAKVSPDAMVLYVANTSVSAQYQDKIEESFSDIMQEDYNGDGVRKADLIEIPLVIGSNDNVMNYLTNQQEMWERFNLETGMGSSVIYIIPEPLFLGMIDEEGELPDILVPLEEALGYLPENAYNEYGIKLSEIPVSFKSNLRYFDKESIVCIRALRQYSMIGANDDKKYYQNNVEFFKDIFEYDDN